MTILEMLAKDIMAKDIALELEISPSTVSSRLRCLEKQLTYDLTERVKGNKRRIRLTSNGKRLVHRITKDLKGVING